MQKKKNFIISAAVAAWVVVYVILEIKIQQWLHAGLNNVEVWPALMAPSLIALMGKTRAAEKRFFITAVTGVAAAFLQVLLIRWLGMILGENAGLYAAIFIIVFLVALSGKFFPAISGPVSFVYYCAAAVLTDQIFVLTLVRLITLVAGGFLFVRVETAMVDAINKKKTTVSKEQENTTLQEEQQCITEKN